MRNRAPNSDDAPTSSSTSRFGLLDRKLLRIASIGGAPPRFGQAQHQPVVGGLHLDVDAEPLAHAAAERHSPRRVDASAEWRVQHHAHGADFVAKVLEHEVRSSGTMPVMARWACTYSTSERTVGSSAW